MVLLVDNNSIMPSGASNDTHAEQRIIKGLPSFPHGALSVYVDSSSRILTGSVSSVIWAFKQCEQHSITMSIERPCMLQLHDVI